MAVRASDNGTVRNDDPTSSDFGLVVRPIGGDEVVAKPTTAVISSVAASATSVLLLAANPDRAGFSIRNTSTTVALYVLANAGTASSTNHTVMLAPGGYYEDPYNCVDEINGIWAAAPGVGDLALVTEYTPVP
jgi:hypothetical protein